MGRNRFVLNVCFWIAFFPSISWATLSSKCPDEFENKCTCGLVFRQSNNSKITYVVNCTDTGFDNTIMLRKLPTYTEELIFTGNEIRDLPLNIFGQSVIYEKLHTVDFSNNHIQTIKGRTFHNVGNVAKLILNDNDLYIVDKDHHPRMFSNFVNLKELHLRNAFTEKVKAGDYLDNLAEIFENSTLNNLRVLNMEDNEISRIYENEFCSLPLLEELHLADNNLKDIPLNFSCFANLKLLDVGNNAISSLSKSTIDQLSENPQHFRLNLTHNPFKCDCEMIDTYDWMRLTPIHLVNKDNFYCSYGYPLNIGRNVLSLETENFVCLPNFDIEYRSSVPYYVMIFVIILFVITVMGFLLKHRQVLYYHMRRVAQPIRSKVQYISLERRNAPLDV